MAVNSKKLEEELSKIDMDSYSELLKEATKAYFLDINYSVKICQSGKTITDKRKLHQIKNELKCQESEAVEKCRSVEDFTCLAKSPCGYGDCYFAQDGILGVDAVTYPGATQRPQKSRHGAYSLDALASSLKRLERL